MIFGLGCAVCGWFIAVQMADIAGQGGTVVGAGVATIGAAVVGSLGVALLRAVGKQADVTDAQIERHVEEIERLGGELDRERARCATLEGDLDAVRNQLMSARDDNDRLRREVAALRGGAT